MSKVRREMKIEKEKKFKKEYLSIIFSALIIVGLLITMGAVILYDEQVVIEEDKTPIYSNLEDLTINNDTSECPQEKLDILLKKAGKVGAEYYALAEKRDLTEEEKEEYAENLDYLPDGKLTEYKIKIKVSGLEDGLLMKITNNYNDKVLTLTSKDFKDGNYIFDSEEISKKITYTVEITSADENNCSGEIVRKTSFTTKVFNVYYQMMQCTMYPNFKYCAQLLDKEVDFNTFETELIKYEKEHKKEAEKAPENIMVAMKKKEEQKNEEEKEEKKSDSEKKKNKFVERIKNNKIEIIVGLSIIIVGVSALVILANMRRKRL